MYNLAASFVLTAQQAAAEKSSPLWGTVKPVLAQLAFGGVVGWSVGFLFKKAFKVLAITAALVFIVLQIMISQGYIEGIEWTKIGTGFKNTFDEGFFNGIWQFITRNIPFGGSFLVGFLIGLKKG
jgi:uncharacterized membrane protein (Fun14 family)